MDLTFRRLRQNPHVRELVQKIHLHPKQFIQPLFVVEGISKREAIPGLDGVYRETPESLIQQIESDLKEHGVSKFLLFGVPSQKSISNFDYSFTAAQIAAVKKHFGSKIWLAVDVCLCSYTEHGHCGILNDSGDHLINRQTVEQLAKSSLQFAQAGADCIAPSDMMDGRIGAIRDLLDENGLEQTQVMSYSAKFHSGFYGPFRVAADSAPKQGSQPVQLSDRATYQIDPHCPGDALLSSLRDAEEGADILMLKPGMPYLDVLAELSREIVKPWAVYQVSGEYASMRVMADQGLMNFDRACLESWIGFARAGASMIISYGARDAQRILNQLES